MRLELLTQRPHGDARTTPILFLHGAWCAAWCWDEHFLPHFAACGYVAHALSLRGHGESDGRERLRWTSIAEYVADVEQVVRQLGGAPVLVGHSMGGFVLQRYLERHNVPAAVLLASAPHRGLSWRLVLGVARRHPRCLLRVLTTLSTYPLVSTPELAKELLFSADSARVQVAAYQERLQEESLRAFLEMLVGPRPKPGRVRTPVLVLAAGDDRVVSPAETHGLALAYRADIAVVPDSAHAVMLDPAWQDAADTILAWLERLGVP